MRLQRDDKSPFDVCSFGCFLRACRRFAGAAPSDCPDRYALSGHVRTRGYDVPPWRNGHVLRTVCRRSGLPDLGKCNLRLDGTLAARRRCSLHCLCPVLSARDLGIAPRVEVSMSQMSARAATPLDRDVILTVESVGKTFGKFVALTNVSAHFRR